MLSILKVVDLIKKGQNRIHCFLRNLRKKVESSPITSEQSFQKASSFRKLNLSVFKQKTNIPKGSKTWLEENGLWY